MTIDPELHDMRKGDYSREQLLEAVETLKNRLHIARTSIHDAFEPETIDLDKLRSDQALDVMFYSLLPDLGRVAPAFIRKEDLKYPVLVVINGLQVSFSGALAMMNQQHQRMVEGHALDMLEEKLGTSLTETFAKAQRIADDAVREMSILFPSARRREDERY